VSHSLIRLPLPERRQSGIHIFHLINGEEFPNIISSCAWRQKLIQGNTPEQLIICALLFPYGRIFVQKYFRGRLGHKDTNSEDFCCLSETCHWYNIKLCSQLENFSRSFTEKIFMEQLKF
jgi:hypothetical protein